ncbi:MAG: protein of unknown function with transmembrane region [Candidatus Campbellbacteria bacterium GW2011_OD1_34_28]|nr:MAG: protein of unknown function with transmembrane region [Candidatus Campbellbacteria bacterium GW2011_OD1_34_28]
MNTKYEGLLALALFTGTISYVVSVVILTV